MVGALGVEFSAYCTKPHVFTALQPPPPELSEQIVQGRNHGYKAASTKWDIFGGLALRLTPKAEIVYAKNLNSFLSVDNYLQGVSRVVERDVYL
jgi:hypothetical protein